MGGGGTMGRKGGRGRRMAVVAMVLLKAVGVSGPRQRAASAARLFALLLAVAPGLCSAQLTFRPIKSVTMGPCNASAIIPCVVTNLQFNNTKTMFVKWKLDEKKFFSYDGLDDKVVKNATFQTAQLLNVHKLSEGIASLTLAKNETIPGNYVCDVAESNREGESKIELKYIYGPCETSVVGSCDASDIVQVSGVVVYTPLELSVENGTPAKLPCTFASSEVISSVTSVTWSFQAEGSTTALVFLYYINGKAYPGKNVPFKDRISWAGDLNKKDASINIANMQFLDNGTYICYVMNPPDIVVVPGEIKLRVVESGRLRVLERVQVSGVVVYTPLELSVENGTEATLPCTFTSSEVISSAAAVTWSFQAEGSTTAVSFFYYSYGKAYPTKGVPFKGRISWAGDLNKKDASIKIANMRFLDNGTYTCDVKNPPDIVVVPGEIILRVLERGTIVSG